MLTSYACECFVTNVLCERLIFLKQTPVYSTIICFFTECVAVNIPNIKYRMPDQLIVLEEYIRYRQFFVTVLYALVVTSNVGHETSILEISLFSSTISVQFLRLREVGHVVFTGTGKCLQNLSTSFFWKRVTRKAKKKIRGYTED